MKNTFLHFFLIATLTLTIGCSSSSNTEGDSSLGIQVIDSIKGTPNASHTLSLNQKCWMKLDGFIYSYLKAMSIAM